MNDNLKLCNRSLGVMTVKTESSCCLPTEDGDGSFGWLRALYVL
jgi:hypothetical protein